MHPAPTLIRSAARQLSLISERYPGPHTSVSAVRTLTNSRSAASIPVPAGAALDESLGVLRRLLAGTPVTHHGEFLRPGRSLDPARRRNQPFRSQLGLLRRPSLVRRRCGWIGIWNSAWSRRGGDGHHRRCRRVRRAERRSPTRDASPGIGRPPPCTCHGPTKRYVQHPVRTIERYSPCGGPESNYRRAPYVGWLPYVQPAHVRGKRTRRLPAPPRSDASSMTSRRTADECVRPRACRRCAEVAQCRGGVSPIARSPSSGSQPQTYA